MEHDPRGAPSSAACATAAHPAHRVPHRAELAVGALVVGVVGCGVLAFTLPGTSVVTAVGVLATDAGIWATPAVMPGRATR